ncbi:MAG: response regulator, partial [Endomicrobiaceae bacterium]|nr:response regulator [Endomicrobiaceae bacterium]
MNDKLKILVVDDEDSLRISLASILELEGYEVKTAEDGYKAIELAKQEDFDIMFSDIRMPGITGTETFKEIKKIKPDIIGVMMTAYALNDLIVDALNSGAFTCLSKPFEIDTILSTIKDITTRPFAVVIDKNANVNTNFLNSLKNCGLNVASSEIDSNKIDFLFKHKPDILIINIESDNNQVLSVLKKMKELFGSIPQTILAGNKENPMLTEEIKKLGLVNFFNLPLKISQVFELINAKDRKKNIALINTDSEDFETLNNSLKEEGFHLLYYPNCEKLFEELNNSFFDLILVNVKIETNIVDFHEKIQKEIPNIG